MLLNLQKVVIYRKFNFNASINYADSNGITLSELIFVYCKRSFDKIAKNYRFLFLELSYSILSKLSKQQGY